MSVQSSPSSRPARLLTQNSQLKKIGVWNWTLPAWAGRFSDGVTYNTCPSAGACAKFYYARTGAYNYANVKAKHQANLRFVTEDLAGWKNAMIAELEHRRFAGAWVRVHDSGDFWSDDYLSAWLDIMRAREATQFYAYTKEFDRIERLVAPDPPANFRWVYSLGGKQDARISRLAHRVADVFPTEESIAEAGWHSQRADDRLAVMGPTPVGMAANNIRHLVKKQAGMRFSEIQAALDGNRDRPRRDHQ